MNDESYTINASAPLSYDEERDCICRANYYNDTEALKRLLTSNFAFVLTRIAARAPISATRPGWRSELLSEAMEGLLLAIRDYDLQHPSGSHLRSYAKFRIDQRIQSALRILHLRGLPYLKTGAYTYIGKIRKLAASYEGPTERAIERAMREMETPPDWVEVVNTHIAAINIPYHPSNKQGHLERDGLDITETLSLDPVDLDNIFISNVARNNAMQVIANDLSQLPETERDVITRITGLLADEEQARQIAKEYNVSGQRINQIKGDACAKLRKIYRQRNNHLKIRTISSSRHTAGVQ